MALTSSREELNLVYVSSAAAEQCVMQQRQGAWCPSVLGGGGYPGEQLTQLPLQLRDLPSSSVATAQLGLGTAGALHVEEVPSSGGKAESNCYLETYSHNPFPG